MRFFLLIFILSFFPFVVCSEKLLIPDEEIQVGFHGSCVFFNYDTEIEELLVSLSVYNFRNVLELDGVLPPTNVFRILMHNKQQLLFLKLVRKQLNLRQSRREAINCAKELFSEMPYEEYSLPIDYGPKFLARARTLIMFKKLNAEKYLEDLFFEEKQIYSLAETLKYCNHFEIACKVLSDVYKKKGRKNRKIDIIECAMSKIKKAIINYNKEKSDEKNNSS